MFTTNSTKYLGESWSGFSNFESPLVVFEDLKHMRDSIDYGTRMNRRLHSLPFHKLRSFVAYKAAFEEIPSDDIDPAYTSQTCSLLGVGIRLGRIVGRRGSSAMRVVGKTTLTGTRQ